VSAGRRRVAAFFAGAICAAICGAVSADAFRGVDVTGQGYGGAFHLRGHDGRLRAAADFSGKVVILSFGFTRCPEICPTTLANLARAMDALGADRGAVQVLMITIDPERDRPEVLRRYVTAFDPGFLGLSGSAGATRDVAKGFKVFYQKIRTEGGGYTMDHSAGAYAIDKKGRTRVFFRYGQPVADIVHDVRMLAHEPS
jgi:protein SCO1